MQVTTGLMDNIKPDSPNVFYMPQCLKIPREVMAGIQTFSEHERGQGAKWAATPFMPRRKWAQGALVAVARMASSVEQISRYISCGKPAGIVSTVLV